MRFTTALALSLALLPSALGAQDAKVEEVLTLMEKRTEGLKDVTYRIDQKAERSWGMPAQSSIVVNYVKGTGLRVHAEAELIPEMPVGFMPQSFDVIHTADALHLLLEYPIASGAAQPMPGMPMTMPLMPLGLQAYRLRYDDPAAKVTDLQMLPQGYPIRLMMDESYPHYILAPRFFFAREVNLSYAGLKPVGGKSCHVLVSKLSPVDAPKAESSFRIESRRKEFFIDAANGALLQIRWDLVAHAPGGMGRQNNAMLLITEAVGSQKVTDALSLPESIRWTAEQGGRVKGDQTMIRTISGLRVNTGLAPTAVLSDAEKNDLYADAILRPAADYEALVAKDPKDAQAWYSLAHARSTLDPLSMMRRMPQAVKVDHGPVARALEKALEARPGSDGAVLNLLTAYKAAGEEAAEKELLDRIVKGEVKGDRVRFRAAARLNASGEYARAGKLLGELTPASELDRRRIAMERLYSVAAAGDEAGISRLFAEEARLRKDTAEKAAFIDGLEARIPSLPDAMKTKYGAAKLLELLDKGMKENPGEPAYRMARSAVMRMDGKVVAAAIELLEAAPADEAMVARAMQALFPTANAMAMMRRNRREPEAPKEWDADESQKLLAALGPVKIGGPGVQMAAGRALAATGKADESQKAFEAALESCRSETAGKPGHATAMRVAFLLGGEKGSENWRERCVDVILVIGKDNASIPYESMYDEGRNPMMALATELVASKDWLKFYSMSCRSNQAFKTWYWFRCKTPLPKDGVEAILNAVYKETDAAKYIELADFLENQQGEHSAQLPEVLEKGAEKTPQDLELRTRLAKAYATHGSKDKAAAAYQELIAKLEGEKQLGAKVALIELRIETQPEKAREVLATVDPATLTTEHAMTIIEFCAKVNDADKGILACRRAFELGLTPNLQMGLFLEKKEDFLEALRHYNRDRAGGGAENPEAQMRKMKREAMVRARMKPEKPAEDAEPETGEEARARLMKKLPTDFLISKLLLQRFPALTADEENAVKAAVEKLSSDESRERDASAEALKKIGPKSIPVLKPYLESTEPEIKARIRQLFTEWAEPR